MTEEDTHKTAENTEPSKAEKKEKVGPDGLTKKERLQIKRHPMPEQAPEDRITCVTPELRLRLL